MNLFDRILLDLARRRGYVIGAAAVNYSSPVFGEENDTFSPEEYGDYIATSNGVYACATGRADLLSSLPLRVYKGYGDDRKEVTSGKLFELMQKVNPFWTMNRLIQMTELSLCLWGKCFWFLERGTSGKMPPQEIWWGKPSSVTVIPDPNDYIRGFYYSPVNGSAPIYYDPSEVIWFRFPNPIDEWQGLSPLAAARIAADYSTDAMRTNRNLFINGLQLGGALFPKAGSAVLTDEQAKSLEEQINRRFTGIDKAHKWGVFKFEAELKQFGITPRDAEYLGGQKLALEDICRAYKWPLDLVGGERTYENFNAALRAAWTHAVLPEGRFIASDITEQLLPMFPNEADLAEFDSSDVEVLQTSETERWSRAKEQITSGALLINEWRKSEGMDPLPWGDSWWAPLTVAPINSKEASPKPAAEESPPAVTEEVIQEEESFTKSSVRLIVYGSSDHERIWNSFVRSVTSWENKFSETIIKLFRAQKASVLAKLKAAERATPTVEDIADDPFKKSEWIRKFREASRPIIQGAIVEAGEEAMAALDIGLSFFENDPNVIRFLEKRTQRFAREVNETTWERLKLSLNQGIMYGEGIPELSDRVIVEMDERIRSTPETIARTEVIGASNGGMLLSWEQSGVVEKKAWLAALDDRTRDSHAEAHERYQNEPIPIGEDFIVGNGRGPAPGQMGVAEEDINCRCTMTAVVSDTIKSHNGRAKLINDGEAIQWTQKKRIVSR